MHGLLKVDGSIAPQLLTIHNIAYMMQLTRSMREAIIAGTYPDFVRNYLTIMFPAGDVPEWVVDALEAADIKL